MRSTRGSNVGQDEGWMMPLKFSTWNQSSTSTVNRICRCPLSGRVHEAAIMSSLFEFILIVSQRQRVSAVQHS